MAEPQQEGLEEAPKVDQSFDSCPEKGPSSKSNSDANDHTNNDNTSLNHTNKSDSNIVRKRQSGSSTAKPSNYSNSDNASTTTSNTGQTDQKMNNDNKNNKYTNGKNNDDNNNNNDKSNCSSNNNNKNDNELSKDTSDTIQCHPLAFGWKFWIRSKVGGLKKGGGSSSCTDWQRDLIQVGDTVTSVEEFWREMNGILTRFGEGHLFLFRDTVNPMWEDKAFTNGGSVNISFSQVDFAENARQAFLLTCLMMVGSLFDPHDAFVYGVTIGLKGSVCRLEIWLCDDSISIMECIAGCVKAAIKEHHAEFFRNPNTRLAFEFKPFRSGGGSRSKPEETTIQLIVAD